MNQKVQSAERAFRIVECFSDEQPYQSLGELAKKTGLSKSTVFRLLATLNDLGYIKQDQFTQKYYLGFNFFHLGAIAVGNTNLRAIAYPHLEKLSKETFETISLNIAEGNDRVCIELIESLKQIRNYTKIGQRNRLWIGASGKALLAHMEPGEINKILACAVERKELTTDDIVSLEIQLEKIKKQGYAVTSNDRVEGSFSIGAPIFDYTGTLIGEVNLSGPLQRFIEERRETLVKCVCETSVEISKELGYKKAINS